MPVLNVVSGIALKIMKVSLGLNCISMAQDQVTEKCLLVDSGREDS